MPSLKTLYAIASISGRAASARSRISPSATSRMLMGLSQRSVACSFDPQSSQEPWKVAVWPDSPHRAQIGSMSPYYYCAP
jgi:hypothetical protein